MKIYFAPLEGVTDVIYRRIHHDSFTGIDKYFKKIILSEDIGVNKPNPKIFEYAIKAANAEKSSSIMIGDAFETDILGAANIGLDQIFLNREALTELPFAPTYNVANLLEIKSIL